MSPEIHDAHPLERADSGLDSLNLRVVDVYVAIKDVLQLLLLVSLLRLLIIILTQQNMV